MAYQDLYQRRQVPAQDLAPIPQPVNQSMIEHYRALNQLPMDASGETYTPEERQQAREIKQLMAEGRFGIGQVIPHSPGSRTLVEPCDFCFHRGDCFSSGRQNGQKCSVKDNNVAAIMLITPCCISGDHPSLTLFSKILLPVVSPPSYVGWHTAFFAGKHPVFT